MSFRTRISVYHADVDITLLNTEPSCRVEMDAYTETKKHKIESHASKGMNKLLKTERSFLLEKLVERKDDIKAADFKDFQTGKRERRRFQMVQRSSIKIF